MTAIEEVQKIRNGVAGSIAFFTELKNDDMFNMIVVLQSVCDIIDNSLQHYELTRDNDRFMNNLAYTEQYLRESNKGGNGMVRTFYMGIVEQLGLVVKQYSTSPTRNFEDFFSNPKSAYEQEKQYTLSRIFREPTRQPVEDNRYEGEIQVHMKDGSTQNMLHIVSSGKSLATDETGKIIEVYKDFSEDNAPYKEK